MSSVVGEVVGDVFDVVNSFAPIFNAKCIPSLLIELWRGNEEGFKRRWYYYSSTVSLQQFYYVLFAIQYKRLWAILFFLKEMGLDESLQRDHRVFIWALATRDHLLVSFIIYHFKQIYSFASHEVVADIVKEIPENFGLLRQLVNEMYRTMQTPDIIAKAKTAYSL